MSELRLAGGRHVYYDSTGEGPALLLLAGRGDPRRYWDAEVAAFAPRCRVVTIDNRDAGESDPEAAPFTLADLADDAAALLRALDVSRAHVLGHSMGGMTALHLALRYPALVDRLVLVSTTAGGWSPRVLEALKQPPDPWIADPVARALAAQRQMIAPALLAECDSDLHALAALARGNRLTPDGYLRQNAAIAAHDLHDDLARIAAPTLVIHGDLDPLIPIARGRELAAGIPGARSLFLPDTGHRPQLERPAAFRRAVTEFLGD